MIDTELSRWLHRLPLAERVRLERTDEQQDAYRIPKTGIHCRCSICGVRLKATDVADPLKRCAYHRRVGRRPANKGTRTPRRDRG
jgi:hypothetical protein